MSVYYVHGIGYGDELYHHGILGQKWGIRRYQNKDGTRTAEGRVRYRNGSVPNGPFSGIKKRLSESAELRRVQKQRIKDSAFSYKLSDEELALKIDRLSKEAKLTELTYNSIASPADPAKRMRINAGRKIIETAMVGIGLYGIKRLISGKFDPVEFAGYVAPKPKNK